MCGRPQSLPHLPTPAFLPLSIFFSPFCTPGCQELDQTVGQRRRQDRRGICRVQGWGLFGKQLLNTKEVESCSLTCMLKQSTLWEAESLKPWTKLMGQVGRGIGWVSEEMMFKGDLGKSLVGKGVV